MIRAVFLDRDGVINKAVIRDGKPYPPQSPEELVIYAGVDSCLSALRKAGFHLICVTNQPDVARGHTPKSQVEVIHQVLLKTLPLDDIRVCYHDDSDVCDCRKPLPGLLTTAAADFDIDIKRSYMVGDRWRDIEAGHNAGCRTVWIQRGYRERIPGVAADLTTDNTVSALEWILNQSGEG